ncbi:MAG: hypothetical protein QW134_09515, partial [Nitrososphaeria archaeon]
MRNDLKYLIILLAVVAIAINTIVYYKGSYIIDNEVGLAISNINSYTQTFWTWSYLDYSGLMNIPNTNILTSILGVFSLFLNYVSGIAASQIFSTILLKWLGFLGMFLLVLELTKNINFKISLFSSAISAIIFTFHFESQPGFLGILAIFLPFVFYFYIRLLKDLELRNLGGMRANLAFLIFSLSLFYGFGGFGSVLQNTIFLIVAFVVISITLQRKILSKNLKYTAFAFFVTFLINLPWILITYVFSKNIAYTQYFNSLSNFFLNKYAVSIPEIALYFGPNLSSFKIGSLFIFDLIIILIFSLIGVILFAKNKPVKNSNRIVIGLLVAYLFIFAIAATVSKPFGLLYKYFLKLVPYLMVFRFPYPSFHYLFLFVVATFFGIATAYLLNSLFRSTVTHKRSFLIVIVAFITIIVSVYIYGFDFLPTSNVLITTPNNPALTVYYHLPNSVFNISDYINKQKGLFSVGILPTTQGSEVNKYYFGPSVYLWLINKPIYTGGYSIDQAFNPPSTYEFYYFPGEYADNYNLSNANHFNKRYLSNTLGIFGIKYIIVQGDALEKANCTICTFTSFNYSSIYFVLNNSNNISFISRYNNTFLYENNNIVPLVYASRLTLIKYSNLSTVFDAFGNSTFSIQNNSLYTKNITILNAYGPTEGNLSFYSLSLKNTIFYNISNFSQPNVSFVQNTPTSVTVHVTNATTPYYLVFRETYDPHWAAFYSNGT